MIRICALNDDVESDSDDDGTPVVTKEAQEEQALTLYKTALKHQQQKKYEEAKEIYVEILDSEFLADIGPIENHEKAQPPQVLKYSCLKNLGTLRLEDGDLQGALDLYIEALQLDDSDVSMWYKLGLVATKLINYTTARIAFQEGLRCSPLHWPSLDHLITLQYVLNDYVGCCASICEALRRDPDYVKGLVLRDKIFAEQPSLKEDIKVLLRNCDILFINKSYNKEIGDKMHKEGLDMRQQARDMCKGEEIPCLNLPKMDAMTWKCLGSSLVEMFDYIRDTPRVSYAYPVDVNPAPPEPMDIEEAIDNDEQPPELMDQTSNHTEEVVANEENAEDKLELDSKESSQHADDPVELKTSGDVVLETDALPLLAESTKRVKRKREPEFCSWFWEGKRRSARVRNVGKKSDDMDENGGYMQMLKKCLPDHLRYDVDNVTDSSPTISSLSSSQETLTKVDKEININKVDDTYFGTEQESSDVKQFLVDNGQNFGIVNLLHQYIECLVKKCDILWPITLKQVFVKAYSRFRENFEHPNPVSDSANIETLKSDGIITLVHGEVYVDLLQCQNSEAIEDHQKVLKSDPLADDVGHMLMLSVRESLFGDNCHRNLVRLHWWMYKYFTLLGNVSGAMHSLYMITVIMERDAELIQELSLKNCMYEDKITFERVQNQLEYLKRSQSLEEIVDLYQQEKYDLVVQILMTTFQKIISPSPSELQVPDRQTQLMILVDSLLNLEEYEKCASWCEVCLDEALRHYANVPEEQQQSWSTTIVKLLMDLNYSICMTSVEIIKSWEKKKVASLVNCLLQMIMHQLEAPDTAIELPFETVLPWTLLHKLISYAEECHILESNSESSKSDDELSNIPGSIILLCTAHDCLGRRSWCCADEGSLLLYLVQVLVPQYNSEHLSDYRDDLCHSIEQAFYCLYAHPNKKTKSRYLQDHGVPQIPLCWEQAVLLFQYYRPVELPAFDSYKVGSITNDVEFLFKRISSLVPPDYDPANLADEMVQYIEGTLDSVPLRTPDSIKMSPVTEDLFYLLGDYYFKNNEWAKAIRNYLLDVCVNAARVDSWAAMALARSTQLETKLNLCEQLKNEPEFLKKASASLRCFKRTLEIDPCHSSMWIEYGSFAYMIHSFCSRLLKQDSDTLNFELFEMLEKQRVEMLDVAYHCFTTADRVYERMSGQDDEMQDERWLHHYMLGKINEKRKQLPKDCLTHYHQAAQLLGEHAEYFPRKISYNNPPEFSVEALEVYYRIHVCMLKYLQENEGQIIDPKTKAFLEKSFETAASSPFIKKNMERRISADEKKSQDSVKSRKRKTNGVDESNKKTSPNESPAMADMIDIVNDIIRIVVDTVEQKNMKDSSCDTKDADSVVNVQSSENVSLTEEAFTPPITSDHMAKNNSLQNPTVLEPSTQQLDAKLTTIEENVHPSPLPAIHDNPKNELISKAEVCTLSVEIPEPNLEPAAVNVQSTVKEEKSVTEAVRTRKERRDSQDSTTSTTSTTTSSSSTSSSSSSSSSTSSSSSSSDSSSDEKERTSSKKVHVEETAVNSKGRPSTDHSGLIKKCLAAFEECLQRFPQHYKSVYRLAHHYFHSKTDRNVKLAHDILLGSADRKMPSIGLFAERRTNNFFNGVWRNPSNEVDRPGSFASHMNRSVSLLTEVLTQTRDHKVLLELTMHLRRVPDSDKKYLRDPDREQLATQAFTLCVNSLRVKFKEGKEKLGTPEARPILQGILLDIYWVYTRVQKHMPTKENALNSLLEEAYCVYKGKQVTGSASCLDIAVKYCQQCLLANRNATNALLAAQQTGGVPQMPIASLPAQGQLPAAKAEAIRKSLTKTTAQRSKPKLPATTKNPYQAVSTSNLLSSSKHSKLLGMPASRKESPQFRSKPISANPLPGPSSHLLFGNPDFFTAAMQAKVPPMPDLNLFWEMQNRLSAELFQQMTKPPYLPQLPLLPLKSAIPGLASDISITPISAAKPKNVQKPKSRSGPSSKTGASDVHGSKPGASQSLNSKSVQRPLSSSSSPKPGFTSAKSTTSTSITKPVIPAPYSKPSAQISAKSSAVYTASLTKPTTSLSSLVSSKLFSSTNTSIKSLPLPSSAVPKSVPATTISKPAITSAFSKPSPSTLGSKSSAFTSVIQKTDTSTPVLPKMSLPTSIAVKPTTSPSVASKSEALYLGSKPSSILTPSPVHSSVPQQSRMKPLPYPSPSTKLDISGHNTSKSVAANYSLTEQSFANYKASIAASERADSTKKLTPGYSLQLKKAVQATHDKYASVITSAEKVDTTKKSSPAYSITRINPSPFAEYVSSVSSAQKIDLKKTNVPENLTSKTSTSVSVISKSSAVLPQVSKPTYTLPVTHNVMKSIQMASHVAKPVPVPSTAKIPTSVITKTSTQKVDPKMMTSVINPSYTRDPQRTATVSPKFPFPKPTKPNSPPIMKRPSNITMSPVLPPKKAYFAPPPAHSSSTSSLISKSKQMDAYPPVAHSNKSTSLHNASKPSQNKLGQFELPMCLPSSITITPSPLRQQAPSQDTKKTKDKGNVEVIVID